MAKNRASIPNALRPWIEARRRFHLSHAHIQMARALGMNPKKFGKLANHLQQPWKAPLPEFITRLYVKRFGRLMPDEVRSIEEIAALQRAKKRAKKQARTPEAREALKRIQESKPDVILLDLMMPEMDGFAVVAALQKEAGWRDIPVIVITSLDLDAKDRARLNSGVQSVLVKERFQPADLVERIRRLVHSKPAVSTEMEAAS